MPSAGAMIARAAISTPSESSSPKGGLPPISIVFICAGFITITMLSLCMWRKLLSGEAFQPVLVHIARGRKNDDYPTNDRPEIFDTWTERCTSKNLKWEEYVPFSVTVLTASGPDREAGRLRGESARVRREREKQDKGICRLQVGVLVAMPSQLHTKTHDGELSGSALRGGMAIGLIEMSRIEEGCRVPKKTAS